MAKRISKKDLDKVILIVAAGYQKIFEQKSVEIKFAKKDSNLLHIILEEHYDRIVGNTAVPELNEFSDLPQTARIVLAQVTRILITKIMNAYRRSETVEIDRDDFQVLSLAIQNHLDNLCNDSPDLVECLAQIAKMFMGVDDLDDDELQNWLTIQASSQYTEITR